MTPDFIIGHRGWPTRPTRAGERGGPVTHYVKPQATLNGASLCNAYPAVAWDKVEAPAATCPRCIARFTRIKGRHE